MTGLFHLRMGIVGRARASTRSARAGSAVAMSSYQACATGTDAAGRQFDFRRKKGELCASAMLLPAGAPEWAADREELWRRVEIFEDAKRCDAQLSRILEFSIPREVPADKLLEFSKFIVEPLCQKGMAAQVDIHDVKASDGGRNRHCHVQLTLREFDGDGFAAKKNREWNAIFQEGKGKVIRADFAARMNQWMMVNGIDSRVDARSNAARGIDLTPEPDIGRKAVEAAKKNPDTCVAFDDILVSRNKRKKAKETIDELDKIDAEIAIVDQEIIRRRDRRGSVAPRSLISREERRQRLFAMLLARRFGRDWIHTAETADIERMTGSPAGEAMTIALRDGTRLIDRGDQVDIHGQTDLAIRHAVKMIELQKWNDGVEITGTAEFRLRVAVACLDRQPPIPVDGLSDRDRDKVDRELARRATERRPNAAAFVSAERARQDARLRAAPLDRRHKIADRIDALDRAAAAIRQGDPDTIRAAAAGDVRTLERLSPAPEPPEPEPAPDAARTYAPRYLLRPKSAEKK